MSGSVVTYTSGRLLPLITMTTGNPEASRLREVLAAMRPKNGLHDHLCDSQPGDPDQWVEEPGFEGYAVEWVPDVGLTTSDERVQNGPSASWCCGQAGLRQEIDAALKADP